ncbi:MAG: hypothetical protein HYY28_01955 [Betaproteobacteria bacterium]|nr:hypothetical protein [Betaproteobacteria bacterium]
MNDNAPIFSVTIDAKGVALARIEPGSRGYRKSRKKAIMRQRDALELHRKLKAVGKGHDGVYAFQFLDTARTFAMLHLQAIEHAIQDNMDRVLAYDATAKPKTR